MALGIVLVIVGLILLGVFIVLIKTNTDIPPNAEVALDPNSDAFKRESFIAEIAMNRKNNG
ncbi:MAG: hypothetical protein EOO38_15915 [Cytophagaceae bacterium]|nr:MAG: hypothetical protein EOO38_15915 [Cytophagaceae bacterium]